MNKSLLGSLDSPSGRDVPLFCQNQIGECYNFPLVWFTWKISTYSSTSTCAHAPTHKLAHMRPLPPIWTPDLFQPSDSHWHLPPELRLLTCWSWWEWMMLLLEEKKGGKGKKRWRGWMWWSGWWRGGSWKEVDCGRQAPHAAPGIHLDPLLPGKVTGRLSLTSSLQRSRRCDLRLFSYNMAFSVTQPVTSPHCLQPSRKGRTVCNVRPSSLSILIDVWIKVCMTNVVAALSLSLKTGDGTEGLHLVGCFQLLAEKQDALLLYRGSLLVAERGRAVKKTSFSVWKWGWTTCAQLK